MRNLKPIVNDCSTKLNGEFTEAECEVLSQAFVVHHLQDDEILLREGERDDTLSIVVSGDLYVTRQTGGNEHITLHHLKPGDVAGAMGFIDGSCHTATLRSSGPSEVITLHRGNLEDMVDDHPRLVYKLMRMIIRSVHQTVLRMDQQFVDMNNYIMKEHGRY